MTPETFILVGFILVVACVAWYALSRIPKPYPWDVIFHVVFWLLVVLVLLSIAGVVPLRLDL